ncbi:hypothetical protein [Pollutibacter soli]|uniref:hypothetical protein n=1 Tax=Pollutibacter soli TaxID=3034157 RepID=UPI003013CDC6
MRIPTSSAKFLLPILSCFCFLLHTDLHAQGKRIPLPEPLNDQLYEYSGLGIYKSKLILLQQYPATTLPGIDTSYIGEILDGKSLTATIHYWKLIYLEQIKSRLPYYQGFEAVTVVDNDIFLSIETLDEDRNCYLVRGNINDSSIILDTATILALPKLRKKQGDSTITIHNIGFESMAWLPKQKRLLLLFEYNRYPGKSTGYIIDRHLKKRKRIDVDPIDFRITDLFNDGKRTYGINYYYQGEFGLFEPQEKIKKGDGFADWRTDCFSRIVVLDVRKKQVSFNVIRDISFENDNWEGIMRFRNGVLLVTDRHPESKLEWHLLVP